MAQEPPALALRADRTSPPRGLRWTEHLLQVPNRRRLHHRARSLIAEAPHRVNVVMLGQRLAQLASPCPRPGSPRRPAGRSYRTPGTARPSASPRARSAPRPPYCPSQSPAAPATAAPAAAPHPARGSPTVPTGLLHRQRHHPHRRVVYACPRTCPPTLHKQTCARCSQSTSMRSLLRAHERRQLRNHLRAPLHRFSAMKYRICARPCAVVFAHFARYIRAPPPPHCECPCDCPAEPRPPASPSRPYTG